MPPEITGRVGRWCHWYDTHAAPRRVLALVVGLIYLPSLLLPFMVDDFRNLRKLDEYHRGVSSRLELYDFLHSPGQVAAERDAALLPWWTDEQMRFRFFRPLSEWSIWLDAQLFGRWAGGSRLASLAWYVGGVWLVLALFRMALDERRARWGALIFALAGGHAIPVVFPAARCDLVALCAGLGATLLVAWYQRDGGAARLLGGLLCYAAALGSKEVSVALALAPWLFWPSLRSRSADAAGLSRRTVLSGALLLLFAATFLAYYARMRYASNGAMMLDPLRAPTDYLSRAPFRILLLLGSWLIQINPFIVYFRETFAWGFWMLGAAGAICLLLFARMLLRHHRSEPALPTLAAWSVVFLPILACTPADDRVLLLPSVGLAGLSALWLTRDPAGPPRRLPMWLFIFIPVLYTEVAIGTIGVLERVVDRQQDVGVRAFGRPLRAGDHLFLLNMPCPTAALWAQDRFAERGWPMARVHVLTDVAAPQVEAIGPNSLRFRRAREALLSSFVGQMGQVRGTRFFPGQVFETPEYRVTLTEVAAAGVCELRIDFRQPLDADTYRFVDAGFFWSEAVRFNPVTTRPASE